MASPKLRLVGLPGNLQSKVAPNAAALLTIVVEFDSVPSRSDVEEIIEKTREIGGPIFARMRIAYPTTVDVLGRGDWSPVEDE